MQTSYANYPSAYRAAFIKTGLTPDSLTQVTAVADLLELNCGGRGEVFSDIEVSEAVDRSLAKLVSAE